MNPVERDLYLRTFTHYDPTTSLPEAEVHGGTSSIGDMAAAHSRSVIAASSLQSDDRRRTSRLIKYQTRPNDASSAASLSSSLRGGTRGSGHGHHHHNDHHSRYDSNGSNGDDDMTMPPAMMDASLWNDEQSLATSRGYSTTVSHQTMIANERDHRMGRSLTHVGPRDLYAIGINAPYVTAPH